MKDEKRYQGMLLAGERQSMNKFTIDDKLQMLYFQCGVAGTLNDIPIIESLSGFEMKPDTLQKIGDFYISNGPKYLPLLKELIEKRRDYAPSRKNVFDGFLSYLDHEYFEQLPNFLEIVKREDIKEVPLELVLTVAGRLLKAKEYDKFTKLRNYMKLEAKNISAPLVQGASLALLKEGRLEEAQRLLEDNGADPSEDFYLALFDYKPIGSEFLEKEGDEKG